MMVPGGSMRDSFLVSGDAFKKTFPYAVFEQQPEKFANPKILLLNIELELKSEKENAEIRLSDPLHYKSFIDAEWNIIYDKLDKCVQSGAKIVLSRLAIGDLVTQYFANQDIFCAGCVPEEDLNQVAAATGGTVQTSVNNVIDEVLGSCEIFEEKQVGNERCNIFYGCPSGQTPTIVLRDLTNNSVGIVDNPGKEIDLSHIASTFNREILTVESKAGDPASEKPNHILDDHPVRRLDVSFYSNKPSPPLDEILSNLSRSIVDLPPALVSEILNFLDPKELGMVSCVSTSLCRLASELHVWKEFYCERWGVPISQAPRPSDPSDEKSWKELFVEREFRSKTFLGRYSIDVLYGHTEAVRTVSILSSKKLIFTSGYDSIVRVWDMEEGLSVASSRPLGCTIRAVAVDTKLLLAGGTDGFIHGWRAEEGHPYLFDLITQQSQNDNNKEFRLWEHEGPITCLALDFTRIFSGSWDMSIRVWDRKLLKCVKVLRHNDWVWSLAPHDTTVVSTSGSNVYVWDTNSGTPIAVISNAHMGNTYSLARSHTGNLFFTGGEDGVIHMFEITNRIMGNVRRVSTWIPHTGPVYSLSFEFPWLVSASSDGKLSLIDVRRLLKSTTTSKHLSMENLSQVDPKKVEPPQRVLHGFGTNLFSVDIGVDRIVCAGEEGVVRVWNFSEALEIERRVRASRGIRLENRMRRRKLQTEMNSRGGRSGQPPVKLNQMNSGGDRNGVWSKRGVSGKG